MKKMILIQFVFLIMLLLWCVFFHRNEKKWEAHGFRKQILDTIHKMETYPFIDLSESNQYGYPYSQQQRCVWLNENITNYELYRLIDYPNTTIKAYSIYIIYYMKRDSSIYLHKKLFNKDTVEVINFNISRRISLEDFIEELKKSPPPPPNGARLPP